MVTRSCILLINIVNRIKEITCTFCSSQSVILYNFQWNKSRFLTFVTTLKVVFFSSVSEQVTVTRSMSVPGVVGLKWTNQIIVNRSQLIINSWNHSQKMILKWSSWITCIAQPFLHKTLTASIRLLLMILSNDDYW